jgi:hypothetical protein
LDDELGTEPLDERSPPPSGAPKTMQAPDRRQRASVHSRLESQSARRHAALDLSPFYMQHCGVT